MPEPQMDTNVAAVLHSPGTIRIENRPMPNYGPHEVLLRVSTVGICGSDMHYFNEGRIGSYIVNSPLVLGHESTATVVGLGENVDEALLGARVAIEPGVPCRECIWCRHGTYNLCRDIAFHATPPIDGTLQRYVVMPADYIFPLPDEIGMAEGAFVEPLAVAVWACLKAHVSAGSRVLITGAGPVGLLTSQVAAAFGATEVVITDVEPTKLELARQLGATESFDAREFVPAPRFDAHIECSGNPSATLSGIRSLDGLGVSVLVGMGAEDLMLPPSVIQERELRITGVFRYANCFPLAIQLLQSGKVQVDPLISRRYVLNDTERALSEGGRAGVLKVIVEVDA